MELGSFQAWTVNPAVKLWALTAAGAHAGVMPGGARLQDKVLKVGAVVSELLSVVGSSLGSLKEVQAHPTPGVLFPVLGELKIFIEEDNLETNFCYFLHPFYCLFSFKEEKQNKNKKQDDKA